MTAIVPFAIRPDAMAWKHNDPPDPHLPEGPWTSEPDKVHWVDAETDLDCLIVRNHFGALCGYVGLPPGHPLHGLDYSDDAVCEADQSSHGGLTYAGVCQEDKRGEGYGICHIPGPGRPADVWWLGFDCSHYRDLTPGLLALAAARGFTYPFTDPRETDTYRDIEYVAEHVTALARDLAAVKS